MNVNIPNNKIMRKLIVAFGDFFNDITLLRENPDGTENQRLNVPIIFAPKELYIGRLISDPTLDRKVQITLPRMSYDMTNIEYDSSRKQITTIKNYSPTSNPKLGHGVYNPVPYNFGFSLYLYVRNIEDGQQIIERILPFFNPDNTIILNLLEDMGITKEVPFILNSVRHEEEYEGDATDTSTRMIIWTLDFTAKAYIYGPVVDTAIIREAIVNIRQEYPKNPMIFNMSNTTFGQYRTGETVFQGYSLGTATAFGDVYHYSNVTNQLSITNVFGEFRTNTMIIGSESNSEGVLNSFFVANNLILTIDVTISPNTALSNGDFKYVTTIR